MAKVSKNKKFIVIGIVVGVVGILFAVLLAFLQDRARQLEQDLLTKDIHNYGVSLAIGFFGQESECWAVPFSIAERVSFADSLPCIADVPGTRRAVRVDHDDCIGWSDWDVPSAQNDLHLVCRGVISSGFWSDWAVFGNHTRSELRRMELANDPDDYSMEIEAGSVVMVGDLPVSVADNVGHTFRVEEVTPWILGVPMTPDVYSPGDSDRFALVGVRVSVDTDAKTQEGLPWWELERFAHVVVPGAGDLLDFSGNLMGNLCLIPWSVGRENIILSDGWVGHAEQQLEAIGGDVWFEMLSIRDLDPDTGSWRGLSEGWFTCFVPIEHLLEGDGVALLRLDQSFSRGGDKSWQGLDVLLPVFDVEDAERFDFIPALEELVDGVFSVEGTVVFNLNP